MNQTVQTLQKVPLIFWDFDGVIKDSVEAKGIAFEKLFQDEGEEIVTKVRSHHLTFGGVSRYEKINLYLTWAGKNPNPELVNEYANQFSTLVFNEVLNSKWIPGVKEYIESNFQKQIFVLVTATPQKEIEQILENLKISSCFKWIFGSPSKKDLVIKEILSKTNLQPNQALMIGDSQTDYEAAVKNQVPFVLRTASYNQQLQKTFSGLTFQQL